MGPDIQRRVRLQQVLSQRCMLIWLQRLCLHAY